MPDLSNASLQHDVEAALAEVVRSLQRIADEADGLSKEARESLTKAAEEVSRAGESLRRHARATARDMVQKAAREVQEHPIASLAAAVTAVAALAGILARRSHKAG